MHLARCEHYSPHCRNGVREYHVWIVAETRLEWCFLEGDEYRPQSPRRRRSAPQPRLPFPALLAGDASKVFAALGQPEVPETSVKSED